MTVPATRTLTTVLRQLTASDEACRLIVGTYGAALASPTYATIMLGGQALKLPKLAGVAHGQEGQPAYILASGGRMLVIGTVSN